MTISSATVNNVSSSDQSNIIDLKGFLKILTDQLTNQDPLKPVDNQEFVGQLAQFASLDQSRQLNEKLTTLLTQQATSQSVGLLGKSVQFSSNDGTSALVGKVSSISLNNGEPLLNLTLEGGKSEFDVKYSRIINIF